MDKIKWEILEDGTISIETEGVSGQNHQSADDMLDQLGDLTGGEIKIKSKKKHTHTHTHAKGKVHQ
jgi:hypothetical protein